MDIDLSKYVVAANKWGGVNVHLHRFQRGRIVATTENIKDAVGQQLNLIVPDFLSSADLKFLSGLLRSLIQKQGIDKTEELVSSRNPVMNMCLAEFFATERGRSAKVAEAKTREAGLGDWSKPTQFFVPDVGTTVRLTEDWTFRLYYERRNNALLKVIGEKEYSWNSAYGYERTGNHCAPGPFEVTFRAGSVLKIDRVYIRKGVKDFSSLTFNAQKGSSLAYNGKEVVLKNAARFWAKLSDVNKMVVEVDRATLSEN